MSKEKELLTRLVGEDTAKELEEKLASEEVDLDELTSELTAKQRARFQETFENDEEFIKKVNRPEVRKLEETLSTRMKRFGIKPEDVKDKSYIERLDLLEKEIDKKISNASKKGSEELQTELHQTKSELQKYQEEILPAKERELAEKEQAMYRDFEITNKLSLIPEKNLIGGSEARKGVLKALRIELNEGADIRFEDGKLVPYEKGKDIKLQNANKTGVLSFDEYLQKTISEGGYEPKSNGNGAGESSGERRLPNNHQAPASVRERLNQFS